MAEAPAPGSKLSMEDADMIGQAVKKRRGNFPDEPLELTIALVLFNIGDRFSPVECVAGEWKSLKQDIPKGEGVPKCPNGHVLTQGPGMRLGWLPEVIG